MGASNAKFSVGQLIHHKLFDYRGVIADVDPVFRGADEWYQQMARSRPPKDEPWYNVLVHGASHQTYVAEQNLELDDSEDAIDHPDLDHYFESRRDGAYVLRRTVN